MEFFNGYILGIITMLIIFYPVIKSIIPGSKPKQIEIEESSLIFYDVPCDYEE